MIVIQALGKSDTFSGTSRAFIMIVGCGYVVNNEDMVMRVTSVIPVYTRLCVKICHCDCIELDFCMLCEYNSLMKI